MRAALALAALLAGLASADAAEPQKWCSNGFDKPATLTLADDYAMSLNIGGTVEVFRNPGLEDGLVYWINGTPNRLWDAMTHAEDEEIKILLFRDRVFWPCEAK